MSAATVTSATVFNPNGDGQNATTAYQWHSKWNVPTSVRSPLGLLDSTSVNTTTGNPDWVQRGTSSATRATFFFHATSRQLDSTNSPLSVASRFSYDVDGRLTTLTHPNGQNTSYSYDISGQLLSRSTPAGTSVTYTRDAFGRILTTAFASPAPTGSGTTSTLYGPHGPVVYQLSSANATVAEEFITDAVGSRR